LSTDSTQSARSSALKRKPTMSRITLDEIDAEIVIPKLSSLSGEISASPTTPLQRKTSMFKAGSQLNLLLDQVKLEESTAVAQKAPKKKNRIISLYTRKYTCDKRKCS
jgi:hypothetical protein